jgi:glycosyltransferase involved in cell wall biosynthesis
MELGGMPELNLKFYDAAVDYDQAIYFAPFLAFPRVKPRSVVVSHGIAWDYPGHPWNSISGPLHQDWLRRIFYAVSAPDLLVSVDTNTLNWIRSIWPGYEHKQAYIPNFVDTDLFTPQPNSGAKIVVLYPRRLTWIRGVDDVKAVAERVTERYNFVEFHFVGRAGQDAEEEQMRIWAEQHPRCKYYWVPMEEMPEVYRQADIVLIPTRAAEGTSLSCLEAMACGKAVINGLVGGLSDLIINDYNGLLVNVAPETLEAALDDLIKNPGKRQRLGAKARETVAAFSLHQWKKRWAKALEETWGRTSE